MSAYVHNFNMPEDGRVRFNRKAHDQLSRKYDRLHCEIFNPIEQERLNKALTTAIGEIRTGPGRITALDYGCGSGNLTRHLIQSGIYTVAADVSVKFLSIVQQRFSDTGLLELMKLNGTDLSDVQDNKFDLVAVYSVLHHVPDYLVIVKELCRVVKPGGVIYIDHERNELYYRKPPEYIEFLKKARKEFNYKRYLRLIFDVRGYHHIIKRLINPRYRKEGDIHVWPDDHIDWDKIEQVLIESNFDIILKKEYLLYNNYKIEIYNDYKNKCKDEKLLIARKKNVHESIAQKEYQLKEKLEGAEL